MSDLAVVDPLRYPWPSETTACGLCGCAQSTPLLLARDRNYAVPGQFQLVRCAVCRLIYLNPRPGLSALDAIYPPGYGPHAKAATAEAAPIPIEHGWRKRLKEHLARALLDGSRPTAPLDRLLLRAAEPYAALLRVMMLPPLPRGGRALDIGCSTGAFLASLAKRGWQAYGVEPDPVSAARAQKLPGVTVFATTLEAARFESASFDLITMWHVLEHLPDPLASVREIRRLLKPGGVLIVLLPNAGSLEADIFGEYWKGMDLPRHFYHFTPATVSLLMERGGLEIRRVALQIEGATITGSLRNLLGPDRALYGTRAWRLLAKLAWLCSFALAQLGASGVMTVYARRSPQAEGC